MSEELETTGTTGAEVTPEGGAATPAAGGQTPPADASGKSLLSDEAKTEGPGKETTQAPEKYALTFEEGLFAPEQISGAEAQFRELNLSNETAQKLVDLAAANQRAAQEQHATQVEGWKEDVRTDKEMGGANFEATVMQARAGLKAFDQGGQVFAMLQQTGYANHPAVIRFLSRIGKAHGEDDAITGKGTGKDRPLWERLYGDKS